MKKRTNNKGITLIALVITIIVLLILAGVSISMLTGDNGILTQAKRAKEETNEAQVKEETTIGQYESYLNRVTGTNAVVGEIVTGGNKPYTNNGTAIIPEGFMIVPGCDDVSQGLVISDNPSDTEVEDINIVANGNQFVWIPVTDEGKYIRNKTYVDRNVSTMAYTDVGYLPDGIQPEVDNSTNNENTEMEVILNVGGFYISRYEAGKETSGDIITLVSKKGATVWNNISQVDCKSTSKTFINNENVKSALCSGIQWDVTMNFVNNMYDGTENLFDVTTSNSNRHIESVPPTQVGENKADKVCNIYDLEGNCWEYVAEMSDFSEDYPFVYRGGCYNNVVQASYRGYTYGLGDFSHSFRFVLYVM